MGFFCKTNRHLCVDCSLRFALQGRALALLLRICWRCKTCTLGTLVPPARRITTPEKEQPAIQHNSCHITGLAQHRTLPQPASEESHMPRQHQTCIENRSSTAKKRGLALDNVSHFSPQILQSGGSQQLGSAATFWPPNIDHLFLRNILTGNQNVKTDSKRI